MRPPSSPGTARPRTGAAAGSGKGSPAQRAGAAKPGKGLGRRRKGAPASAKERIATAAAPLHDRRRRLVGAREATLRDLGGLMLEMYKRNRFREELLLDKCEEVLAVEVEIAHVDQRLFQLAPPNAAGMRPIGRCECGAPIHPGQNFCGVCGRSFTTLTQSRACARCGAGLRSGDQFCATCGTEAPDVLQALEAAPPDPRSGVPALDGAAIASDAVAETVIIEAPPLDEPTPSGPSSLPNVVQPLPVDEPFIDAPTPAVVTIHTVPVTDAAAEPSPKAPEPDVEPAPALAPPAAEEFSWTATATPEAAIDAAIDAIPSLPLTASIPPPPMLDGLDDMDAALPPTPAGPVPPAAPFTPSRTPAAAAAAAGVVPAFAPPAAPVQPIGPTPKEVAKREVAAQKERAKAAKARAKARAKAAREARKRGGDDE